MSSSQPLNEVWEKLNKEHEVMLQKAITLVPKGLGIKNFRSLKTSDGLAFNADVTYNKKKVGYIENSGTGGPDNITFDSKEVEAIWNAAVEQMFATITEPDESRSSRFAVEERMCDALLTREGY